jgi:D-xylose transport system substrate-binding protein
MPNERRNEPGCYLLRATSVSTSYASRCSASALNKLNNKIDGVLVANDGMAVACINALKAQKLNGKIPITGQDATVAGLQQVLVGNQSISVYKPVKGLATAAAQITYKFLRGKPFKAKIQTDTQGGGKTPTVLLGVVAVTKANMKATVLKDKWVSRADLCNGIAAACTAAGI